MCFFFKLNYIQIYFKSTKFNLIVYNRNGLNKICLIKIFDSFKEKDLNRIWV